MIQQSVPARGHSARLKSRAIDRNSYYSLSEDERPAPSSISRKNFPYDPRPLIPRTVSLPPASLNLGDSRTHTEHGIRSR